MSYLVTARGKIGNLREGHSPTAGDRELSGFKPLFFGEDRSQGPIPV